MPTTRQCGDAGSQASEKLASLTLTPINASVTVSSGWLWWLLIVMLAPPPTPPPLPAAAARCIVPMPRLSMSHMSTPGLLRTRSSAMAICCWCTGFQLTAWQARW